MSLDAVGKSMKKFFISMLITLVGVCASAQKQGDMSVGFNLGVAPCLESGASVTNFGLGGKFQYNVTNPVRLEADVDYWFKSNYIEMFDVTANVHYLFNVGSKAKVYPLVGIGYGRVKASLDFLGVSLSAAESKLLVNVGAGIEYPISQSVSLGAEIKYQYVSEFSRLPISVGLTYHF